MAIFSADAPACNRELERIVAQSAYQDRILGVSPRMRSCGRERMKESQTRQNLHRGCGEPHSKKQGCPEHVPLRISRSTNLRRIYTGPKTALERCVVTRTPETHESTELVTDHSYAAGLDCHTCDLQRSPAEQPRPTGNLRLSRSRTEMKT